MAIGMMRVFNHYADELYNKIVEEDQAKSAVKRSTADVANPKKADLVRMFFMMKQSEGVASTDVNQSEVARMFGMSQPQVSAIRKKMIADGMLTDGASDETEDTQEDVNEQEVTDITVTSSAQDVADDSQEDVNISSSTDESQLNTTDSPTPSKPPKIDNSTDKIGVSPDKRKKDNPSS
jgi:predicted XRE-type DNA-binding protein